MLSMSPHAETNKAAHPTSQTRVFIDKYPRSFYDSIKVFLSQSKID
jgi:hypothetical protein